MIPWIGKSNPLQYFYLKNFMDKRSLEGYSPRECKESDITERAQAPLLLNEQKITCICSNNNKKL